METALTVLAYTLTGVAIIVGIPVGNYYFARGRQIDAQTEAIKEDTRFRAGGLQTGTLK